jgi:anti-sigma B factor antagonist
MRESASELDGIEFQVDEDRPRAGTLVLAVRGEADLHVAPELRERISAGISDGTSELVLDLSDTTFVDSMTLGVLLSSLRTMRERDGWMRLVVDRPDIRRVFEITLLDDLFPIHSSLEEALAADAAVEEA